jgi:hypothetical protein
MMQWPLYYPGGFAVLFIQALHHLPPNFLQRLTPAETGLDLINQLKETQSELNGGIFS